MTILVKQLTIPVEDQQTDEKIPKVLSRKFGIPLEEIQHIEILKKSLDARKKSQIQYHYRLEAKLANEERLLKEGHSQVDVIPDRKPDFDPVRDPDFKGSSFETPPVIIGSGPAGIFAALVLAEAGHPSIIVERGEPVEDRLRTVNRLRRLGEFSDESNYCFGEGGAGTFSDGKLTCGRNHPYIKYLFEQWVRFGAPKEILYDAHPHIGTDNLLVISKRMRSYLKAKGCEFLFSTKFESFHVDSRNRYTVHLSEGQVLETDHLVCAIGHSARDTYRMLFEKGVAMTPKPFAIGARFEHPQEAIDKIQFGSCQLLPPAEYKLAARSEGRGIWTFCMCPGGQLLPTSAQAGQLAINGMSYHARISGFANAAVVVNVNREDFFQGHPLDGIRFQEALEKKAYAFGGGGYVSPAQRLTDFLHGKKSKGELKSTYKPGVNSARIDRLLPKFVVESLQKALYDYNKRMQGFLSSDGIVAGVETKTSAPVSMPRGKDFQSESHPGFYPTGEGAGFAGGIVSAALDGVRVGSAVMLNSSISKVK
ncbi:MAG: FAD-dependent monooxygenase [Pseudobacteriovorax sp.]|nr:FAD-dependent monooxygenase [Pseudobacteriovorax sp.]